MRLAQRDFDRARQLYEPIEGFSNVSVALRQVDDDDRARQVMADAMANAMSEKNRSRSKRPRYTTPEGALAVTKSWESNVISTGAKGAVARPAELPGANLSGWRYRRCWSPRDC